MLLSQGEDADKEPEAESESRPAAEKPSAKSSNSLESLYSGQSSSSTSLHGTNKNNKKQKTKEKDTSCFKQERSPGEPNSVFLFVMFVFQESTSAIRIGLEWGST